MACKYKYNNQWYTKEELVSKLSQENSNFKTLYQNLVNEITNTETGRKVLDRIKRDYKHKDTENVFEIKNQNSEFLVYRKGSTTYDSKYKTIEEAESRVNLYHSQRKYYTLEEQQEEAIVELLGLMTAEKLDAVKDGKLISLLKRLLKEMKQFVRSLINQKEVEIDKLPDNMTLGDLSDLLAYSNSKLILPGNEVIYTTPDNEKFKTYQEASNHISELAKNVKNVDLDDIDLQSLQVPDKFQNYGILFYKENDKYYTISSKPDFDEDGNMLGEEDIIEEITEETYRKYYDENNFNSIKNFIEKNKEYEQSKEIIEEWKKVNNIQYNPEEIYSRGQEFSSVVGAYSSFDVNLMMQNLLSHIEDNEKAGGQFAISAYTKPIDKQIGHLEGGGGKIKFKLYPQSNDILWAANTDVYSGSVWDASEKVNKDKKSELLGVSYTKYPSLQNVNAVQPNLASIINDLQHHHNELGISLTGSNFRLEYDEDIPYSTKKIIDNINSILDQKYGKLVKPEIKKGNPNIDFYIKDKKTGKIISSSFGENQYKASQNAENLNRIEERKTGDSTKRYETIRKDTFGIQPTQTNERLKESIDSVKNNIAGNKTLIPDSSSSTGYRDEFGNDTTLTNKEYTNQALINTKIAKLKEVAKKYPRSLIRSEVKRINTSSSQELYDQFGADELPFQKIPNSLSKEQSDAIDNVFDNNPELANSVYEALGFKTKTSENEITRGIKEILPFKVIGDYSNIEEGLTGRRQYSTAIDGNNYVFDISTYSYENEDGTFQSYYDIDFTVNGSEDIIGTGFFDKSEKAKQIIQAIISQNYGNDTIRLNVEESKKGKQRLLLYKRLMNQLGYNPSEEMEYTLFYDIKTDKVNLTPQQKQQAQQLYSRYLESLNKPNTNPILQGNQEAVITPNDKIVFGHPTIGKTFLKEKGITNFISFDDDFAEEINNFVNTHKGSLDKYQYKQSKPKEYIDFSLSLYDKAKAQAKKESKILFTSSNIIFENRINDFDKVINLEREEFFKRIRERKTTYDIVAWKDQIDNLISKVDSNKVINTRLYLSDLLKNAIIKPTDKIIWGHPAIGKSYAAKKVKMIDFDSYKLGINKKYNLYIAPGLSDTELRTDDKTREARENWRYESEENQALWNQFIRDVWQQAKKDAKEQGAILFASDLLVLREFGNEVDKALTMPDELFFERSKQRNNFIEGELGTKVWKGNLNRAVNNFKEKFGEDKVISTEKYLSDLFTNTQQEQVKKFAELQERLNNKEFLKGAKNAFESSKGLQEWGTQEQYNDYIARVSLGIVKNPSSGKYNYESQVKDIVYHGTKNSFEIFDKEKVSFNEGFSSWFEGFHFATDKNTTLSFIEPNILDGNKGKILNIILDIKNLKNVEDSAIPQMSMEYWDSEIITAKRDGYDALEYTNQVEGNDVNYVVFKPEQILILGSKQDINQFKTFVGNTVNNIYQTTANDNTIAKVKVLLETLGVNVETTDSIINEFGANAVIDLSNNLIQIANGKENVALTEEAMHLITALLPKETFNSLYNEIEKYDLYKDTYEIYSELEEYQNEDSTPNIEKIKFEAIGKILAEFYIMKSENLSFSDVSISQSEYNKSLSVWQKILQWIKSVFKPNVSLFQDVINQLESGDLILNTEVSRQDRLFQAANARFNRQENLKLATKITNNNNLKVLTDLEKLVKDISDTDLKVINNNKKFLLLSNKDIFASAENRINDSLSSTEMLDKISNALDYFASINRTALQLELRVKDIKNSLPSSEEKSKLVNELNVIDNLATIYEGELNVFNKIFESEDDTNEFKRLVKYTNGILSSIKNSIDDRNVENAKATFAKVIQSKINGYKRIKQTDILNLQKSYNKNPSPALKEKIDKLQSEYDNPPFSVDSLWEQLQDSSANSGRWLDYMEGGLTSDNQVMQTVSNLLFEANNEAIRDSEKDYFELQNIFKEAGLQSKLFNASTYQPFISVEKRYLFKERGSSDLPELLEYDDALLISEKDQWRFDDEIEIYKYLIASAKNNVDVEILEKVHKGLLQQELSSEEKLNPEDSYKARLNDHKNKFGQRMFTDEYYKIQEKLDVKLSTGQSVRDYIKVNHRDKINLLEDDIENAISQNDNISLEAAIDEKYQELKKLKRLEVLRKDNGEMKEGDALIIANALNEYKSQKQAEEVDEFYVSDVSKAKWEEQKDLVDEDVKLKTTQYKADPTDANKLALDTATEKQHFWYSVNTINETPKKFYDDRKVIIEKISNLLKGNTNVILKDNLDTIWGKIINLSKGYRNSDGIINGSDILLDSKELAFTFKELEQSLVDIKLTIRNNSAKLDQFEYEQLNLLFQQLEEIQTTGFTEYWVDEVNKESSKILLNNPDADVDTEITKTEFFKLNTVNVTELYQGKQNIPPTVLHIGDKYYQPTYIWRTTTPSNAYKKETVPSSRWSSYRVNKKFINPNYKTIQNKIRLADNAISYGNSKYGKLDIKQQKFLSDITDYYFRDQETKKYSDRLGNSLPKINSSGLAKYSNFFMMKPTSPVLRNFITPQKVSINTKLLNLVGNTNQEEQAGLGIDSERSPSYIKVSEEKKNRVAILAKYSNRFGDVRRQDTDLFNLLSKYNIESHRVQKMRELLPAINTTLKYKKGFEQNYLDLRAEVEKRINNKSKNAGNLFTRISDWSRSSQARIFIGMPYQFSSIIKNQLQGTYALFINNSRLKQHSEASMLKAYVKAIRNSVDILTNRYTKTPSKYNAVIRRLGIINDDNIADRTNNNKEALLKLINNLGYTLSGLRQGSELQLLLTIFEHYRAGNKILDSNGMYQDILDMYDYSNGVLTPKGGLTAEIENSFKRATTMGQNFTAGNFGSENAATMQRFWLGRQLSFMRGFIYNPGLLRFGAERTLITGETVKGYYFNKDTYKALYQILKTFSTANLTQQEKVQTSMFLKDFLLVNIMGYAIRVLSQYLQGTDDDEEYEMWLLYMHSRKLYQELSFTNPVNGLYIPAEVIKDVTDDKKSNSNVAMTLGMKHIGRPAMRFAFGSIFPAPVEGLRFGKISKKSNNYYAREYRDNLLLYNLHKIYSTRPDMLLPEESITGFKYFNPSIVDIDFEEK